MLKNIENMNDPQVSEGDFRLADTAGGPVKTKPISTRKIALVSILLLAFVGYLVYDKIINPTAPPQHATFDE